MTSAPHNPTSGSVEKQTIKLILAVPARLGSTRLPRKPLASLAQKPLIVRVAERVATCAQYLQNKLSLAAGEVVTLVATDSQDIVNVVQPTGLLPIMTAAELPSGTDRILAAVDSLPADIQQNLRPSTLVINLQGDEPFFDFDDILRLAEDMLKNENSPMGTLAFPQEDTHQFIRTSVVKVVCDAENRAIYFSRSPIPWPRESFGASQPITSLEQLAHQFPSIPFLQHVGVYAYRLDALRRFTQMPPSALERLEGLEQLRALDAGWAIRVIRSQESPFGIDTPEDLQRAEAHFSKLGRHP